MVGWIYIYARINAAMLSKEFSEWFRTIVLAPRRYAASYSIPRGQGHNRQKGTAAVNSISHKLTRKKQ